MNDYDTTVAKMRNEQHYYPDGTECPYNPSDCGDFATWAAVLEGDYP